MNRAGQPTVQSQAGPNHNSRLQQVALYALLSIIGLWLVVFGWIGSVVSSQPQLAALAEERLAETSRLRWLQTAVDVDEYLRNVAPQYVSTSTDQPLFSRTLSVEGELAATALLWRSGGRTVAVAASGVATERVESPSPKETLINDQTNLSYRPGDRVASPELVEFLATLSAQQQFELSSISLSNSRTVQVQLEGQSFTVTMATDIAPQAQLDSVTRLLEQGSAPSRYVDTTVAGRLFWQ